MVRTLSHIDTVYIRIARLQVLIIGFTGLNMNVAFTKVEGYFASLQMYISNPYECVPSNSL